MRAGSGRWPLTPEADGTFTIGRSPNGFSMVLQFLRGHNIDVKTVTEREMAAFKQDIDYYGLPVKTVEAWLGRKRAEQWSSVEHSEGITVAEQNMLASRDAAAVGNYHYAIGANSYGLQEHVLITMRIEEGGQNMLLGVIGQQPASNESFNDPTCIGFDSVTCWRGGHPCGPCK